MVVGEKRDGGDSGLNGWFDRAADAQESSVSTGECFIMGLKTSPNDSNSLWKPAWGWEVHEDPLDAWENGFWVSTPNATEFPKFNSAKMLFLG